jgi:hypothetical protein
LSLDKRPRRSTSTALTQRHRPVALERAVAGSARMNELAAHQGDGIGALRGRVLPRRVSERRDVERPLGDDLLQAPFSA